MMVCCVAPRPGAWIEIVLGGVSLHTTVSPPVRGRGLKYAYFLRSNLSMAVAPRPGAWIEICISISPGRVIGRPPSGGVD